MNLNYKVFGQGDPVIILHGLFGSLDNWQTFAKSLSEHYMVYIIDQRDHGKSPHTDDFSFSILADDLHTFMEEHWIYQAHLIGHSMGGKTVMQFAMDFPDMVDTLTVVDIAPKYYEPRHSDVFQAINSIALDTLDSRLEAMTKLKSMLDDATAAFLAKNINRNKDGSYTWKMNVSLLEAKYEEISGGLDHIQVYDGPVLFVKGEKSNYIQDSDQVMIKEIFPQAQFQTIANAGHWVHADQADLLMESVISFFNQKK